jgi:hypothetical protein
MLAKDKSTQIIRPRAKSVQGVLVIVLLILSQFSHAQSEEEMKRMQEYMQKRIQKLQKSLFSDDHFFSDDFDDNLKDMEKQLGTSLTPSSGGQGSITYEWKNNPNDKVLVINKPDGTGPVDISIENGMIKLSSRIEKKTNSGSFISQVSSMISVPQEVDENKVDIKDKGKTIEIIFALKGVKGESKLIRKIIENSPIKPKTKRNLPKRRPIKAKSGDITL